ncbi:MAG: hypothetical protein ACRDYX_19500 [Egibacteraceae bacterium]
MSDYIILAEELSCPPELQCPKISRTPRRTIAVVGVQITSPEALAALGVGPGEAAVEVSEPLYRAGYQCLDDTEDDQEGEAE